MAKRFPSNEEVFSWVLKGSDEINSSYASSGPESDDMSPSTVSAGWKS